MTGRGRLCFVVTSHVTAVTFLRGYLASLRGEGWDVTLVCSPGPGLVELAREEGVGLRAVPMRREPSPLRDVVSLFRLVGVLRRVRPDVLVYATPKASLLSSVAGWVSGVGTRVFELWGLRLETTRGVARAVLGFLDRVTSALSSSVVANSVSLAARAHELGVLGRKRAVVLGAGSSHGVDAEWFSREAGFGPLDSVSLEFLGSSSGLVVGFVGRVHPDKGVDTLLEAMELCAAGGVPVRGVLVGEDEGADVAGLVARVGAVVPLHLPGGVADPRPFYAVMDVLVLVSLREGFPNVVLEAAAMGVPAVVSDSTGTVDSVVDGVTGLVVPVGDAAALARALGLLAGDESMRVSLGGAARARAVREYAQRDVWRLHADHFASELERAREGRG